MAILAVTREDPTVPRSPFTLSVSSRCRATAPPRMQRNIYYRTLNFCFLSERPTADVACHRARNNRHEGQVASAACQFVQIPLLG